MKKGKKKGKFFYQKSFKIKGFINFRAKRAKSHRILRIEKNKRRKKYIINIYIKNFWPKNALFALSNS